MSTFTYNGVTLELPRTRVFHQQPVHDSAKNYLYTRYVLEVEGIYNPRATAYARSGRIAVQTAGTAAPTTLLATRHLLLQPRRRLTYTIGGVTVLDSPQQAPVQHDMDAANGPTVIGCDVDLAAEKTFRVKWAGETCVNECQIWGSASTPSPLLSHTWQMHHRIDQDAFTTRTVDGQAVFHAGRLDQLGATVDDYRSWLIHPVPTNFKRLGVDVWAGPKPDEYRYQIVDREQAFNILPVKEVSRIECTVEQTSYWVGIEKAAGNVIAGAIDIVLSLLTLGGHQSGSENKNPRGPSFNGFASGILGMAPANGIAVSCRVWGNRRSNRRDLYDVAVDVVKDRIFTILAMLGVGEGGAGVTAKVMQDVMGKFVQVDAILDMGPVSSTGVAIGQLRLGKFFSAFRPVEKDHVTGVTTAGDSGNNPDLVNDNRTRGTYDRSAVARAVKAACESWDAPTVQSRFTTRRP